ncbi:MAG: hypothetical protein V3S46_01490 [Nitrospinota bacterium]
MQSEAKILMNMRKFFTDSDAISLPPGSDKTHELVGEDEREKFLLDLWRGTIRLSKLKYQTRGRKVIVLVRMDIGTAPHTNPDGVIIEGNHIHLYREGYEDKWAYPLKSDGFRNPSNILQAFDDFCRYCNIKDIPSFQEGIV